MIGDQLRPSRIDIILNDFRDAKRFAAHILDSKLHSKKSARSQLIHRAFNTALVIAYARPFSATKESENARPRILLGTDVVDAVLVTDEKVLHNAVITLRNTVFGHSDASAYEFPGFNYNSNLVRIYKSAKDPLSEESTRRLKTLSVKWLSYVKAQRQLN